MVAEHISLRPYKRHGLIKYPGVILLDYHSDPPQRACRNLPYSVLQVFLNHKNAIEETKILDGRCLKIGHIWFIMICHLDLISFSDKLLNVSFDIKILSGIVN
jgi:hypothetical protein